MKLKAFAAAVAFLPAAALVQAQEQPDARQSTKQIAQENAGIDRAAAIGHALCMAIEGSEFWSSAHQGLAEHHAVNPDESKARPTEDTNDALKQHAQASFASSRRLFDAVRSDEKREATHASEADEKSQACEQFFQAAVRYSEALEACCKEGAERSTQSKNTHAMDASRVVLLNHAVKEAVGGVGLRKMIQHHNDQSAAALALKAHAGEMLESSHKALRSAGVSDNGRRNAARPAFSETEKLPAASTPAVGRVDARENKQTLKSDGNDNDLGQMALSVVTAVEKLDKTPMPKREEAGESKNVRPAR